MTHLFISYAHVDSHFVSQLKMRLEHAGIPVWMDTERLRIGMDWREEIDAAIRKSFAVVVVVTPAADRSKYVTYEWACAWGAGITIVPLMLEQADLHPRIGTLQHIDFSDERNRSWPKFLQAIKRIRDEHEQSVIPPIISSGLEALNNFDPEVRKRAAQALAVHNHQAIIPALVKCLEDPDIEVREKALIGLGHMEAADAIPALIKVTRGDNNDLRFFATKALGQINDAAVIPALIEMLYDDDSNVRVVAEQSLERRADAHSISYLLDVLQDDDSPENVRYLAIELLGKIGEPVVVPHLVRMLVHPSVRIQYAATNALRKLGTPDALAAIGASHQAVS